MQTASRTTSTVDKALQVLQALSKRPGEWGVSELASQLGQARSVIHSILRTLVARGFVEQDERTKRYRLGTAILLLAQSMTNHLDLRQVAHGPMQVLSNATGECAYLLVPSGNACVTILRTEPPVVLRLTTEIGSISPLHAASNPKAILAYMHPDQVRRYLSGPLEKATPFTPTDPDLIIRELEEIRRLGYAYTEGELFAGVAGIAAPIFDAQGEVVGSVGVGGLVPRIQAGREEITTRVVECARVISASLGFSEPYKG